MSIQKRGKPVIKDHISNIPKNPSLSSKFINRLLREGDRQPQKPDEDSAGAKIILNLVVKNFMQKNLEYYCQKWCEKIISNIVVKK